MLSCSLVNIVYLNLYKALDDALTSSKSWQIPVAGSCSRRTPCIHCFWACTPRKTEPGLTNDSWRRIFLSNCRRLASGGSAIRAVDQASVINADSIWYLQTWPGVAYCRSRWDQAWYGRFDLFIQNCWQSSPLISLTIRNNPWSECKEFARKNISPARWYLPRRQTRGYCRF